MTSEIFVYITLPGQVHAVTAARFEMRETYRQGMVGRLVYGQRYLSNPDAVEIDPTDLSLTQATVSTARLGGIFGALRDAGPDHWGRRVIERNVGGQLGELDYLLHSPDDRAGALGVGLNPVPPAPLLEFNKTIDLARLQELADRFLTEDAGEANAGNAERRQVEELLLLETSMGGARPKNTVEDGDALWLAKFRHPKDRWNNPRVEHGMLELARRCGIDAAYSRVVTVGDGDVLLVKRFDREKGEGGYLRHRMVSGLTVLQAEEAYERRERWSYVLLADEIRRVCRDPAKHLEELFRRMVFNSLISNVDDHPRNHALLAPERAWGLSPAYDLTPTPMVAEERRDLAMEVGAWGRWANRANLLSECGRFLLTQADAVSIADRIEAEVRGGWYPTLRQIGVTEADCEAVRRAFDYSGYGINPTR